MRLKVEQVTEMKEYFTRCIKGKISSLVTKLSKDGLGCIDTIEALQQENEQLQAQVAQYREALEVLGE